MPPLGPSSDSDSDEPISAPQGAPAHQLEVADWQKEPTTHRLYQPLVELLRKPDILGLHAVRQIGREKQLHLRVKVTVGGEEMVLDVLFDTGAQVSLVKAGLLPREHVRLSLIHI